MKMQVNQLPDNQPRIKEWLLEKNGTNWNSQLKLQNVSSANGSYNPNIHAIEVDHNIGSEVDVDPVSINFNYYTVSESCNDPENFPEENLTVKLINGAQEVEGGGGVLKPGKTPPPLAIVRIPDLVQIDLAGNLTLDKFKIVRMQNDEIQITVELSSTNANHSLDDLILYEYGPSTAWKIYYLQLVIGNKGTGLEITKQFDNYDFESKIVLLPWQMDLEEVRTVKDCYTKLGVLYIH